MPGNSLASPPSLYHFTYFPALLSSMFQGVMRPVHRSPQSAFPVLVGFRASSFGSSRAVCGVSGANNLSFAPSTWLLRGNDDTLNDARGSHLARGLEDGMSLPRSWRLCLRIRPFCGDFSSRMTGRCRVAGRLFLFRGEFPVGFASSLLHLHAPLLGSIAVFCLMAFNRATSEVIRAFATLTLNH